MKRPVSGGSQAGVPSPAAWQHEQHGVPRIPGSWTLLASLCNLSLNDPPSPPLAVPCSPGSWHSFSPPPQPSRVSRAGPDNSWPNWFPSNTSNPEASKEQLRALRAAVDTLRLLGLDQGSHTRSIFLTMSLLVWKMVTSEKGALNLLQAPTQGVHRAQRQHILRTTRIQGFPEVGKNALPTSTPPAGCLLPGGTGPSPLEIKW